MLRELAPVWMRESVSLSFSRDLVTGIARDRNFLRACDTAASVALGGVLDGAAGKLRRRHEDTGVEQTWTERGVLAWLAQTEASAHHDGVARIWTAVVLLMTPPSAR